MTLFTNKYWLLAVWHFFDLKWLLYSSNYCEYIVFFCSHVIQLQAAVLNLWFKQLVHFIIHNKQFSNADRPAIANNSIIIKCYKPEFLHYIYDTESTCIAQNSFVWKPKHAKPSDAEPKTDFNTK